MQEPERTLKEESPKRKYQKRTFEGRQDGGPVTRSRKIPSASLSYAEVLKKPKLINSKQSVKLINPQTQVFCHEIKNFKESQLINFVDEVQLKKRQAKAKLTREDILKLNSKQLTSFKDSVQRETEK